MLQNQNPKTKIQNCFIAVDLGAGSGRVFLVGLDLNELLFEEIHRFQYPPKVEANHLRWDFSLIFGEIKKGLFAAGERARELNREIYSIGVDSWGVDYGLIDTDANLLANPVCYRDKRTIDAPEKVFSQMSRARIFEKTGIQFLNFNTLFQLFTENAASRAAVKFLLLPDLINFFLTGKAVAEYTNATTTQMVNARTKNWDSEIVEKLNLPRKILPEIIFAGTNLGFLKNELAAELNLEGARVVAPATHDTASAVAGAPLEKKWAYISSGTWSLVGVERDEVLINEEVARHNFTNEGGAFGTIRFLKNVMGLWILESCRREWKELGINIDYDNLISTVKSNGNFQGFIFPDDERFLNPPSMVQAIVQQLDETGQILIDESPVMIAKIIFDSLAFRYASVLETIENLTNEKIVGVQIVGGGGRNEYLNQMTANACRLPVQTGLVEATVTGNVLVQAISAGRFPNLSEARRHVAENIQLTNFTPQSSEKLNAARISYRKIREYIFGLMRSRQKMNFFYRIKQIKILFAVVIFSAWAFGQTTDNTIRFDVPAEKFTQSLPLGNGRLGAMVFGGAREERIILNESSLWSGSPQDSDKPDAAKFLPEIRRLLVEGKNAEAEALVYKNFTAKGAGSARGKGKDAPYGSYQTLGNLRLIFPTTGAFSNYRRDLNLSEATARVFYEQNGVKYTREIFVSAPDEAIVVRLTADKKDSLNFTASLDRPERATVSADGTNNLLMSGQLNNGTDGNGMKYAARLRVVNKGGNVSFIENKLKIENADEIILFVTAATDYQGFAGKKSTNPAQTSADDLNKAAKKNYKNLLKAHVADFQNYFNRVSLNLPPRAENISKTTPERLKNFGDGINDASFAALYFQFGRYLLISSSRPGGLPANLQGIWAEGTQVPWNADWHLNINVQMNYWLAENTNLSELHQPLFSLIESLQKPGAVTAKKYYNARGWVAHVLANPWGFTSPGEGANWGATNSGSAWLCQHLWEHYLYTKDEKFLKYAYPMMKDSALFYTDMLIEEPKNKWLVTAPSNSPENGYRMANSDKTLHIVMGPTVDEQIIRYLFDAVIKSSEILGTDADFRKELTDKKARLAPTRVGADGRVMEWLEEYDEPETTHRHVSHLWALYPGNEISLEKTPALAEAARKTLEKRGDVSTGWSLAHKINFWARLGDGNRAYKLLANLLSPVGAKPKIEGVQFNGGSYENLFDAHPPFQIDGNFGAAAGIAEMLVQSQNDAIKLLPAVPSAWKIGSVKGLVARGGFVIDINWADGKLINAAIFSKLGGKTQVNYGGKIIELDTKKGKTYRFDGNLTPTK